MNSGLRPLPKSMPFRERCWSMVRRGEAKSFEEARQKIGRKRRVKSPERPVRLPYADQ